MKLIVFLGNPGLKYRRTRHNLGFMAADFYARKLAARWRNLDKFGAAIAEATVRNQTVRLLKPQKFYNLTGEVVQNLVKFYKLSPKDLLVVCDDLNLGFGVMRYRERGSDGGNNGLKSIIASLRTEDFARLRIGTGNALKAQIGDTDFVLSRFRRDEQAQLPEILATAAEIINQKLN
ncbi:MAG: aminoacyl-tRNA hydrolase [Candidatus Nomurabacteria bacterium]|jgi:PTH1 family peptidyl-tRNA hydrolase|nr:aminoacyl-tRNA hydrolase [Candidatus Nomurabacteria bacterium]